MTHHDFTGVTWRKSSYSGANGGECVSIAELPGVVAVRDTKNPEGAILQFPRANWQSFVESLKASELG